MRAGLNRPSNSGEWVEQDILRRYTGVQEMVVDYAIGLAILGLFQHFLKLVLMIALLLVAKMVWDIARKWRFAISFNPIAVLGLSANTVGACAMALLAWVTIEFLGAVVPGVESFSLSAALMSGSWTLGASVNTFLMNGFLHRHEPTSVRMKDA